MQKQILAWCNLLNKSELQSNFTKWQMVRTNLVRILKNIMKPNLILPTGWASCPQSCAVNLWRILLFQVGPAFSFIHFFPFIWKVKSTKRSELGNEKSCKFWILKLFQALYFKNACCATNSTSQDILVCCMCAFCIELCIILLELGVLKIALLRPF